MVNQSRAAASESHAQTTAAIERAVDVLSLFGEQDKRTLGVTEIAQELGISKAVVHRILSSFRAKGFVELDPTTRRYTLGPKVLFLGLTYLDRIDLRGIARQAMEHLSARTHETATLSIRDGWTRVYIDQVTPVRDIKMVVALGRPFPLHAGASSKAFLAFLPEEERERFFQEAKLERLTPGTITDQRKLRRDLESARQRGYAFSEGERQPGAGSVAAPLRSRHGDPMAVISVCGPAERFRDEAEECAVLLLDTTRRLSRQLGYSGL